MLTASSHCGTSLPQYRCLFRPMRVLRTGGQGVWRAKPEGWRAPRGSGAGAFLIRKKEDGAEGVRRT